MSDFNKKLAVFETGIHGGGSFTSLSQFLESFETKPIDTLVVIFFVDNTHTRQIIDRFQSKIEFYIVNDSTISVKEKSLNFSKTMRFLQYILKHNKKSIEKIFHYCSIKRIKKILKLHEINIVYLNTSINRDSFIALAAESAGVRKIYSHLRSINVTRVAEKDNDFFKYLNETINTYITNSQFTKKYWEKFLSPSKIQVVYNGFDDLKFYYNCHELFSSRFHKRPQEKLFFTGGRLVPYKNFIEVIKNFSYIKSSSRFYNSKLIIVGVGSERERILDYIFTNKILDVFLFDYQINLSHYLHCFDFAIFGSTNEPFGRLLIESMASGLIVFANQSGAFNEIIKHKQNGFLVDIFYEKAVFNYLENIIDQPKKIKTLKENAIETVHQHFNAIHSTKKIRKIVIDD